METLFFIILSTVLVSLISFVGVFTLSLNEKMLDKLLRYLVALSVGVMMAAAFLDLIPESLEKSENSSYIFLYVLIGFLLFFVVEKILHWRHCHQGHCSTHTLAYMNIFGDGLHNFIDGLIVAASYMVSFNLGFAVTLAIILHEIPQEISDFGVLIYAGFKKSRALLFNFFSAILAVAGGVAGYFLLSFADVFAAFLLPLAAGGFIYIAAADLTPEIKKETDIKKSFLNFLVILGGILIIYLLKLLGLE